MLFKILVRVVVYILGLFYSGLEDVVCVCVYIERQYYSYQEHSFELADLTCSYGECELNEVCCSKGMIE